MGETVGDYLRRRRLEVAAMRLAGQPRLTVLQVALSVGFSSAEAFTRAFNARFGCSPTAWRTRQAAKSNPGQAHRNRGQASAGRPAEHERSGQTLPERLMNVKLVDRPAVTLAYLRHVGPYGAPLARFWQEVYYPWAAANNLLGRARYGISHDDPSITAPRQCRYDAGVEVAPDFVVSGRAFRTTLPGGKYAVLRCKATAEQMAAAWSSLLRDWLPSSGLQLDARPWFEHYPVDAACDPRTGEFECDICIPVVPL
jgi:AraC family transcriptional regulator